MIDRDKVIKAFECCSGLYGICIDCPYREFRQYSNDTKFRECVNRLQHDVHELLKADQLELIRQRDRIETLERIVDHMEQSINENLQYLKILAMRR